MDRTALSVVVPTHNAAHFLERTMTALMSSDLPREQWELIVVDDASTDNSSDIAAPFADRIVRTGSMARGPAYARNRGAEAASATVLAFVDADVLVHADALRLMLEDVGPGKGIGAAFGSYDDGPADQAIVSQYRNLLHHYVHNQNAGETSTFWAGCGVVSTDAFRNAGMFDEDKYSRPQIEDIELGYRLRAAGVRIVIDPRIQCTHLKSWRILSMLRTDFGDRAVPWVRLLLASPGVPGPSPSLGGRELVGSIAVAAAAVCFIASFFRFTVAMLAAASACLLVSIWVNRGFYRWLSRRRGGVFIARVIPLHLAYQLLSAIAVPFGVVLHIADSLRRKPAT